MEELAIIRALFNVYPTISKIVRSDQYRVYGEDHPP